VLREKSYKEENKQKRRKLKISRRHVLFERETQMHLTRGLVLGEGKPNVLHE